MSKDTGDTDYWRKRAEHMRNIASSIADLTIRRKIENVADVCDKMAEWIGKVPGQCSSPG